MRGPSLVGHDRDSVAIIGAAGFIGRSLCERLEAEGVRVARFTRTRPFLHDGRLSAHLVGARTIFFVATSINPARAERQVALADEDQRAFVSLLDGLRAVGQYPTLVYTSSGGTVYDAEFDPPYAEGDATRPTAAYGRCKLLLEQELLARRDAVRPVILRLANIYGPGQPETAGVVARWLGAAARREPIEIFGTTRAARDYLYVDDTVDAMMRCFHHLRVPEVADDDDPIILNIGSGVPVMLARLVDLVSAAAGRPIEVRQRDGRPFDRVAYWLDIADASRRLGWRPRTPLEIGVRRVWQSIQGTGVAAGYGAVG